METIFRKVSAKEAPKKNGNYFIAYKDNNEIVFSDSAWSKDNGWWTGVKDCMIYWLEEIELPSDEEIEKKFLAKGLMITKDGQFSEPATIEMYYNYLRQEGAKWMRDFVFQKRDVQES